MERAKVIFNESDANKDGVLDKDEWSIFHKKWFVETEKNLGAGFEFPKYMREEEYSRMDFKGFDLN